MQERILEAKVTAYFFLKLEAFTSPVVINWRKSNRRKCDLIPKNMERVGKSDTAPPPPKKIKRKRKKKERKKKQKQKTNKQTNKQTNKKEKRKKEKK